MATLVTGGAGFIGSHFIELLLDQVEGRVVCLDNYNNYYDPAIKYHNTRSFSEHPLVKMVNADVCDPDVIRRVFEQESISRVVHFAAYAGVRPSVRAPIPYAKSNVLGTLVLLEAARRADVKRFVFASSSTVYGRGAQAPFREDAPNGVALSPYGATKQAAEQLCLTYHELHKTPIVICRPFSVYGPRLRPDLALTIFTQAVMDGKPIPLFGDGSVRRDFTHVQDICNGFLRALTREGVVGEVFNLGHDEPIAMVRLIDLIESAVGRAAKVDRQPAIVGEMPITHADLEKSRKLLGFDPTVPIEEGVAEYVDWFRRVNA